MTTNIRASDIFIIKQAMARYVKLSKNISVTSLFKINERTFPNIISIMLTAYRDISEYVSLIVNFSLYKTDVHISKNKAANGIFRNIYNPELRKFTIDVISIANIVGTTEANLFFSSEFKKTKIIVFSIKQSETSKMTEPIMKPPLQK